MTRSRSTASPASPTTRRGRFDAVAFGTKFLANPDLPARIAAGADLNAPKADLFYTGKVGDLTYTGPEGYTDYPPLAPN